jgi:hypothetical protein
MGASTPGHPGARGEKDDVMTTTPPVQDWASDFDVLDPDYVADPFPIWDELRPRCPIPHTNRRVSSWLPLRYEDVTAIAHDIEHFSSRKIAVIPITGEEGVEPDPVLPYGLPPISSDPPLHTWTRRLLLPWFSHRRVESYEQMTRDLCNRLLDGFLAEGRADAAADYAQQIPVRVIAHILGVPPELSDTFTGWVRDVLEFADDPVRREEGSTGLINFFVAEVGRRKDEPGHDLLSELLHTEMDGELIDPAVVLGIASLVLIAGVDTTWSAIGSSLWHLATHDEDRKRMVSDPAVWPLAIEELLRAYSPVTMAREVTEDVVYAGCPMAAGDKVLMNFPAANRDPEIFEDADTVVLDRALNRHVAFGSGIHRCAGSNLARMELRVALEEWLRRVPEFHVAEGATVTWACGQVRGPRSVPVVFR